MTSRLLDCSGTEQDYSSPIQLYGTGLLILSSAIPFYHLSKPTLLYNQCDDFYFVKNFASLAKKPQKLVSKLTNRTLFWKFQKHRNYKPEEASNQMEKCAQKYDIFRRTLYSIFAQDLSSAHPHLEHCVELNPRQSRQLNEATTWSRILWTTLENLNCKGQ